MKFIAVKEAKGIVVGGVYYGSVVVMTSNGRESIRIVVHNDNEKWRGYPANLFVPAEEQ